MNEKVLGNQEHSFSSQHKGLCTKYLKHSPSHCARIGRQGNSSLRAHGLGPFGLVSTSQGPKAITRCSGVAILMGCHPPGPRAEDPRGGEVGLTALQREHLPGPLGPCVYLHGGPSSPEPLSITILQEGLQSEVCRQAYRWINACVRELFTRVRRLLPGGSARTLTCVGGGERNSHTGKRVGGSA